MSSGSHLSLSSEETPLAFKFSTNGDGLHSAQSTELPPTERRLGCGPAELAL